MARTFDGNAANRLSCTDASLRFHFNGLPFTLSVWVKFATVSGDKRILAAYDGAQGPLLRLTTGTKLGLFAVDSGGATANEAIGATTITTGQWYHFAATWDGNGTGTLKTLRVYVNGALDGSATLLGMYQNNSPWRLGSDLVGNAPISADAGECAMWNTALSAAELAALANGINPFQVRPANLKAYWPIHGLNANEPDLVGTAPFVLVGSLATAPNHAPVGPPVPTMYGRSRSGIFVPPAIPPVCTVLPVAS